MSNNRIKKRFGDDSSGERDVIAFLELGGKCAELVSIINLHCPESPEKVQALARLEECNFWARRAVIQPESNKA